MRVWSCFKCHKDAVYEADLDPLTEAEQSVWCHVCGAEHCYYDGELSLATPMWKRIMWAAGMCAFILLIMFLVSLNYPVHR